MEPWAQELIDTWNKRTPNLARALKASIEQDPTVVGKYHIEDLEQMMRGPVAMLAEELEGGGTDIRDSYLQSVIPGILAQGEGLDTIVSNTLVMAVRAQSEVAGCMSDAHRKQAGDFLCDWYARYVRDLVKVGLEELKQR